MLDDDDSEIANPHFFCASSVVYKDKDLVYVVYNVKNIFCEFVT